MPIDWSRDEYVGRPSVSPVLAALVAADVITKQDRVLDVGCGRGTDALALASWGFRRIDAIDINPASLTAAKRRARSLGVDGAITWARGSALDLAAHYDRGAFDVVLDTLLANNLPEDDVPSYLTQLARVLRKGGLLVMHTKVYERSVVAAEDGAPTAELAKWFAPHVPLGTHLAEGRGRHKTHVPVVLRIARRNARPA